MEGEASVPVYSAWANEEKMTSRCQVYGTDWGRKVVEWVCKGSAKGLFFPGFFFLGRFLTKFWEIFVQYLEHGVKPRHAAALRVKFQKWTEGDRKGPFFTLRIFFILSTAGMMWMLGEPYRVRDVV